MSIYWIIAIVSYVIITFQLISHLHSKASGYSALEEKCSTLANDCRKAESEIHSLKRLLEQEKMSRRVDSISTKMQSHFEDILTEVTEEASIALSSMAEDVKEVKTKNVAYVRESSMTDGASSHMKVKSRMASTNLTENLA